MPSDQRKKKTNKQVNKPCSLSLPCTIPVWPPKNQERVNCKDVTYMRSHEGGYRSKAVNTISGRHINRGASLGSLRGECVSWIIQ